MCYACTYPFLLRLLTLCSCCLVFSLISIGIEQSIRTKSVNTASVYTSMTWTWNLAQISTKPRCCGVCSFMDFRTRNQGRCMISLPLLVCGITNQIPPPSPAFCHRSNTQTRLWLGVVNRSLTASMICFPHSMMRMQ